MECALSYIPDTTDNKIGQCVKLSFIEGRILSAFYQTGKFLNKTTSLILKII